LIATFINWCLPCVPVTRLITSPTGKVSDEMKAFCSAGNTSPDPSISAICTCLSNPGNTNCATISPDGVPDVQVLQGWLNPNLLLAYLFMASSAYQLVLRNSLDVKPRNPAGTASMVLSSVFIAFWVISIYQHPPQAADVFVFANFFPQQLVVLVICMVIFYNIERSRYANDTKNGEAIMDQFKMALWNGGYRAATLPFIAVLLASFQHVTDENTLQYVYHLVLFVALCDLTYGLVAVEEAADVKERFASEKTLAPKYRLQQTAYLVTLAALLVYSIFAIIFMPIMDDPVMGRLTLVFIMVLWILHILYDAANAKYQDQEYHRTFNVADGILASLRYAIVFLVGWIII
jgi:hypothetical protein